MKSDRSFSHFLSQSGKNFFTGLFNIFIFLPYHFSITQLLKTLFYPWKHLVSVKTQAGFSFNEWAGRLAFNLISAGVGFFVRSSVIFFYIIIQMAYVLVLPLLILIYILLLPLLYLNFLLQKPEVERKRLLQETFLKKRLLAEENRQAVEAWFEFYYQLVHKPAWWQLSSLFSAPPIGRDWSMGYTPTLDRFAEELTKPKAHFPLLVDREKEIQQIELTLAKSAGAHVVIAGEEGVGKHTIVEALAKRIYDGRCNPVLAYKRIIKLDLEKIMSQSVDMSQKEALLKSLFEEAKAAGNIILLIDRFDRYISGGAAERIDLTLPIAEYARTGGLQFFGITTPFYYQKYVAANDTIQRLFEKVDVFEIPPKEALEILMKTAFAFEARFHVIIPYETLKETIDKSQFYITTIPFPEKAITLLDEACVYATESAKNRHDSLIITPEIIDLVLSKKTHVPVRLDQSFKDILLNLESLLSQKIISQKAAIGGLATALRKSFTLASSRKKPLASFLFFGPTGVGKTETAKALAQVFFGSAESLIRFDMSFYQTTNDIITLIGSLESGNPGLLTTAIRQKPYGVLLLDEIEKAHKDLLNIFLTVLDEGYFVDGYGKRVDCKNLMIIATSNAGSDMIYGFSKSEQNTEQNVGTTLGLSLPGNLLDRLVAQKIFTPEFLNRFDGVILYQPLNQEALTVIAQLSLKRLAEEVYKTHGVLLSVSETFLQHLVAKGYDPHFGARNLARVIRDEVEDKIAQLLLADKIHKGETVRF